MAEASQAPASAPAAVAEALPELPQGVRLYEGMWLVDANVAKESLPKVLAGIRELIEKSGGTWVNGDRWDERRLAYPVKKKKRGMYVITHFTSPTESLTRLDRNARISDLVLRHLILKDEDGLTTLPPVRGPEEEEFGFRSRGPRDFGGRDREGGGFRDREGGGFRDREGGGFRDRGRGDRDGERRRS